jgi:Rrf2 family protein
MADLIRMSEATALGLHTMAVIARRSGPTPTTQIATELRASEAHLSKVLQQLVRVGLLHSKRGPSGGYALARPPTQISLLDVYEALEGPLRQDGCLFTEPICQQVNCILGDLVERLRTEAHDHLESTSLSDVVNGTRR